jgi:hypothetical protein
MHLRADSPFCCGAQSMELVAINTVADELNKPPKGRFLNTVKPLEVLVLPITEALLHVAALVEDRLTLALTMLVPSSPDSSQDSA